MNVYQLIRERIKNVRLIWKFFASFFIISLITLFSIGYFSYTRGKALLTQQSFSLLENVTREKKESLEEYFDNLKAQALSIARNPSTIESLQSFSQSFQSYSTPLDPDKQEELIRFYRNDFEKVLKYNQSKVDSEESYLPPQSVSQILQHKYLATNPNPYPYKNKYIQSEEGDPYDQIHSKYHPSFESYCQNLKVEDLLLVDTKGNIVYSVEKRPDFASNFFTDPYKSSPAARLFRRVNRQSLDIKSESNISRQFQEINQGNINLEVEEGLIAWEDYDYYTPNFHRPSSFVATPVYTLENNAPKKLGVLILQVNNQVIQDILTNKKNWIEEGLGESGEAAIIGPDYLIRSNTRRFIEDPIAYAQALEESGVDSLTINSIQRLNTTILLRQYKIEASVQAIENRRSGTKIRTDFLGKDVIDVFLPIEALGTNWAIITEMNADEIYAPVRALQRQILFIILGVSLFVGLLGWYIAWTLSRPMLKSRDEISMLAKGIFPKKSRQIYRDELGEIDLAMNQLIENLENVAIFAEKVGKGDFNYPFQPRGPEDRLGYSLLMMRDNLRKVSEEERIRTWVDRGTALFSQILRNNSQDLQDLGDKVISELVKYLDSDQGAFFLWVEREKHLEVLSTYAYDRFRYSGKIIQPGEGLLGQTVLERDTIVLKEIPKDYPKIRSGLGESSPRSIILVPVQSPEKIYGVIEIASFNNLEKYQIEFIENTANDIALSIQSIQITEDTQRLLEESRKAAQKLKKQEEEMRQNFDELISSQEEIKKHQEQLNQLLDSPLSEGFGNGFENSEIELDISHLDLDQKIKDSIQRQKSLLDHAIEASKRRKKHLNETAIKIEPNNGLKKTKPDEQSP